jgi:hypothetical protein
MCIYCRYQGKEHASVVIEKWWQLPKTVYRSMALRSFPCIL